MMRFFGYGSFTFPVVLIPKTLFSWRMVIPTLCDVSNTVLTLNYADKLSSGRRGISYKGAQLKSAFIYS